MNKPLLALAAGLAFSAAGHATTYSFVGQVGLLPGGPTTSFDLEVRGPVTQDTLFPASALTDCQSAEGACQSVSFYVDANASGLSIGGPAWSAVSIHAGAYESYYYFQEPAFTVNGEHLSVGGLPSARLTVSEVPEPAAPALLGAGLPLLAAAARRRRRTA